MNKNNFYVFDTTTHEYDGSFYQAFIENKNNEFYEMNDKIKKNLYSFNYNLDLTSNDIPLVEWGEGKNAEIKKIKENKPILVSGCSITSQSWWAQELSKKMNLEHNNLAWPGDSTIGQIRQIFWYIKEIGTPEYIFALFPSLERFEMPINTKWFNLGQRDTIFNPYVNIVHLGGGDMSNKYLKIPYDPEIAIPVDLSQYYSSFMINILSEYCKAKGINFVWGTWDQRQYYILNEINKKKSTYYEEMIDMEADSWEIDFTNSVCNYINKDTKEIILCHEHEKKTMYHENFDFGSDIDLVGPRYAHFGFHRHLHIAEIFYNYYLKNWKDK